VKDGVARTNEVSILECSRNPTFAAAATTATSASTASTASSGARGSLPLPNLGTGLPGAGLASTPPPPPPPPPPPLDEPGADEPVRTLRAARMSLPSCVFGFTGPTYDACSEVTPISFAAAYFGVGATGFGFFGFGVD